MIKASIFIPVYNAEKTITEVLDSIYSQSVPFDEIIVINDCSTDKTLNYLESFKNLKIFNNSENKGLSFCRNIGIKNSKNDVVASIDADVVLDKFWLEKVSFQLKDNVAMCGGNLEEKYTNNIYNKWRSIYYKQNWGNQNIVNPAFLFGCNTIQKKTAWEKIKGYDESLKLNGEDIDYSFRLRKEGYDLFYCHEAKCLHLQNDDLKSLSSRVWRYHSFGYKIKKISYYRFIKLITKQFKFFAVRSAKALLNLNFRFILINFKILLYFIKFELKNVHINK
jgi:glycosyltransferase involved in cell wall biosynthesis